MRNVIIEKLKSHLTECPGTEADVVYALVEVRKLLDQADKEEKYRKYGRLSLVCNWVVHIELCNSKVAEILEILENGLIHISFLDLSTSDKDGKAGDVLSFDLLRGELSQFCKTNDLPTKWVEQCWGDFLTLLAQVVQDCPLTLKQPDIHKKLRKAVLTATDESERSIEEPHPGKVVLHLDWELTLDNGETREFGYNFVLSDQ
jgi:hypothetical protein